MPISKRGLDTWQSEERRERMDRLLEWYLVPQSERKPKTMKALAEQMGVTPETLRRYKKDAGFQRELLQRQRTENKVERVGDVLDMLYSQALEGNVQAAKAWLAWVGKAVDTKDDVEVLTEMSDEQIVAMAAQLLGDEQADNVVPIHAEQG